MLKRGRAWLGADQETFGQFRLKRVLGKGVIDPELLFGMVHRATLTVSALGWLSR